MSTDPENQYFCDGLTEELINRLAQIPRLRVVARTSSFQFKDAARDIREVGRLLDVSKVLEGSVRKAGNRIRVTVQLINVADGCHLWSERYEGELTDIFAIHACSKLARDHHVIAFDLRGHGKSGKPHDPGAYGREFVQDALRLLDHLQIRRAYIVGYSLGATIAAKLLTTDPGRFLTVTLGASGGSRNWEPEDDRIGERNAAELESDVPFRRLAIAMTPRDEPKRTEADIWARSEALAAINDIKALAAYNRGGMRELEATDEEMSAVKVPVLGVVGSVDAALRGLKELQTILPSMRLVVIDGATHAGERSAARRPEFVNAVREFIASHRQVNSR